MRPPWLLLLSDRCCARTGIMSTGRVAMSVPKVVPGLQLLWFLIYLYSLLFMVNYFEFVPRSISAGALTLDSTLIQVILISRRDLY